MAFPAPTDAEAIVASRAHPEAFAVIFDRHHAMVHGYLRRRLGRELADDLLAETFTQAFRSRARYVARHETCRAWLLGVAAHLIANHRRAERRRLAMLQREAGRASVSGSGGIDEAAERAGASELSAALLRGLRRLDARDREALLLYAWAELTYPEIAEALGTPVGTVRSRLHRARTQLRERLDLDDDLPALALTTPGDAHAR